MTDRLENLAQGLEATKSKIKLLFAEQSGHAAVEPQPLVSFSEPGNKLHGGLSQYLFLCCAPSPPHVLLHGNHSCHTCHWLWSENRRFEAEKMSKEASTWTGIERSASLGLFILAWKSMAWFKVTEALPNLAAKATTGQTAGAPILPSLPFVFTFQVNGDNGQSM